MSGAEKHDLSCVAHVHSTYSDGTASVSEILQSARSAGRDAVLLTDHDTLQAKREGWEGWHDGVLLLVGVEISPPGGHYLAFGLDREIDHRPMPETEIPGRVAGLGGFGFAAHPFSQGSRISKRIGRPHPWPNLGDPAVAGVELWSLATDSAENWAGPVEALRFLRDPEGRIVDPPPANLASWDALLAKRPTAAFGGLDAHQPGIRVGGRVRSPMPNDLWFRMLGTHLLLDRPPSGELEADRALVYGALRSGRSYICRDSLGDPAGFDFSARSGDRQVAMGETVDAGSLRFVARAPEGTRMTLLRNGRPLATSAGPGLAAEADSPGVYRLEARVEFRGRSRTWVLSNAIRLGVPS